jgi:hypothetical protein
MTLTLPSFSASSPSSPSSCMIGLIGSPSSVLTLLACCLRFLRRWRSVSALSRLRRTESEPSLFIEPPCKPSSIAAARSAMSTSALLGGAPVADSLPSLVGLNIFLSPSPSSSPTSPSPSTLMPSSGIFCPLATRTWCLSFNLALRRRSLWSLASGFAARSFCNRSSMAPVLAGDLGASESDDKVDMANVLTVCACLRRMEISLRRCWSSSCVFFSLDFYPNIVSKLFLIQSHGHMI